ncbi:uncharacterized protein LOC135927354 [Gordionus sp. m RMFG-2023]|uniref:uncharacterized protein LOC135927354 n=1 Tax=Gordionus sp. m RMFG-2023 TaxID=3053472 RepID=UPI0031FDB84D
MGANLAKHLISIFNIFGAPKILYTDNTPELKNESIHKIVDMWPGCKIMHGRPKDSPHGLVERVNKDIMKTTCWADALETIQFQKNISYHRGIKASPYEVMFGHKPHIWDSSMPKKSEDPVEDTAYMDDDKSFYQNLVDYTDSDDPGDFEHNSIRENYLSQDPEYPSPDLAEFENNPNSQQEYYPSPDLAEFENNPNSQQEYCSFPDLATEDDIIRKHINAIKKIRKISKHALKMTSDKKLKPGEIDDSLLLPIPVVDQGRLDHKMLMAVITDKSKEGFYKLGTSRGYLSGHYARSQFDLTKKKLY